MTALTEYAGLLADIKTRIQAAQTRALFAVNAELIHLYWEIGRLLDARQATEGWGAAVIPRLAQDIRNELPEVKGFSVRNIDRMLAFARAYPQPSDFSPQPVAKLQGTSSSPQARATRKVPQAVAHTPATPSSPQPVAKSPGDSLLWQVPWGHHALLLAKVKPLPARRWYIEQALAQGWSRNTLMLMIDSAAHTRQGARASNGKVHTRGVWVYDLRTNKHFSLKTRPLKTDDLQDFVACYRPDNRHQRQESERFRYFDYETLVARDKASLDVFWLKDSSLENLDDLPPPDVLQQEIIDHLEAALSAFRDVAAGLPKTAAT